MIFANGDVLRMNTNHFVILYLFSGHSDINAFLFRIFHLTFTMIVQVNGKVRGKIEVASETTDDEMKSLALEIENVKAFTEGKEIVKVIVVPKKLVNIVVK